MSNEILQRGLEAYLRRVDETVERYGRLIQQVAPGEDGSSGFAYTIGNALKGTPELFLNVFWQPRVASALNPISDKQLELGRAFEDGELVEFGWSVPVKIARIDHLALFRAAYTQQATNYYGHENYGVLQVLVPDVKGRWPEDPTCDDAFRSQLSLRDLTFH